MPYLSPVPTPLSSKNDKLKSCIKFMHELYVTPQGSCSDLLEPSVEVDPEGYEIVALANGIIE